MSNSKRLIPLLVAALGALGLLLVVAFGVSREAREIAPTAASGPAVPADRIVATVNGDDIDYGEWLEMATLDQVMSSLAGVTPPTAEETLQRMINELLVLQATMPPQPSDDEIAFTLADLQSSWGLGEEQVTAALEQVGLQWETLESAIVRLLRVQQGQTELLTGVSSIESWLAEQGASAEITVDWELINQDELAPVEAEPTPAISVPDFTLEQAGGGELNLYEQLEQGAVVLVFFQKCG